MKRIICILMALGCVAERALGQGTVLWNEALNGPLANEYALASSLGTVQNGTNSIIGTSELLGAGVYGDYFSFVVPSGLSVSALWLSVDKPIAAWIGDTDFANQLGYVVNPANADVLPQWGLNPIGSGSYGMYVKNYDLISNPSVSNYRLDFVVQSIPEPGTLALAFAGVVGLLANRQRHFGAGSTRMDTRWLRSGAAMRCSCRRCWLPRRRVRR